MPIPNADSAHVAPEKLTDYLLNVQHPVGRSKAMSIAEHDVVVLTRDLPEHALRAGDVGAVVHVYADGKAYEVEFVTGAGQTLAVATLPPTDIRPLGASDMLHIRSVTAA